MNSLYRYDEPPFAEVTIAKPAETGKTAKAPASAGQDDDDELN